MSRGIIFITLACVLCVINCQPPNLPAQWSAVLSVPNGEGLGFARVISMWVDNSNSAWPKVRIAALNPIDGSTFSVVVLGNAMTTFRQSVTNITCEGSSILSKEEFTRLVFVLNFLANNPNFVGEVYNHYYTCDLWTAFLTNTEFASGCFTSDFHPLSFSIRLFGFTYSAEVIQFIFNETDDAFSVPMKCLSNSPTN